jgi:hypothetical protein
LKAGAFAAVLILLLPAVLPFILEGAGAIDPVGNPYVPPGAVDAIKDDDYMGWPTDTSKVDIVFEQPIYSGWNLTGNLSINVTVVNRLNQDLNLTVYGWGKFPFDVCPQDMYRNGLEAGVSSIFPPLGNEKVQFNLTMSSYQSRRWVAYTMRYYVFARDNTNRTDIGANHTDIVGLAPVSVKVTGPVPSGGSLSLKTNTGYSITAEVTNYSNETLEGALLTLEGTFFVRDRQNLLLSPHSTEKVVWSEKTPSGDGTIRTYYYFESENVSSWIGFDLAGDVVTNVTAPHLQVVAIELLRVDLIQNLIELAVPVEVNFTVMSMANKSLRDQRFEVQLYGWMNNRIIHKGYFVIKELVPGNESTVQYRVVSRVAGTFGMHVVTYINGQRYQFDQQIYFSNHIVINDRIEYQNDREQEWKMYLGERLSLKGYIKNLYPYTLKDVTITVMMIADIGGFLSQEDFMSVAPRELKIESLAPNQTAPFAFNVTADSAGNYNLAVGVFWGGNATPGGLFEAHRSEVSRPSAIPIISRIIPAIPIIAVIPKIIDALIRKWKKIGY